MLPKPLVMTGVLGAAVAAPIALTEGPKHWPGMGGGAPTQATAAAEQQPPELQRPDISSPEGPGALIYQSPAPIEGVGFVSVAQMLRMDVTKEWVYARWARKSTGLGEPGLFGVRVPVVTGTAMTDLAGSLSYYFNQQGRVDKIRFHGRTADTTQLVQIAQKQFGMKPQPSLAGEQLYQTPSSGYALCELRTRPKPVLWSTSPHDSFEVDLEINRPGTGLYVWRRPVEPNLPASPEPQSAKSPPPVQAAQQSPPPAATPDATSQQATTDASGEAGKKRPGLSNAQRPTFRWPN